jgi:hypothetical protein
MTVTRITLTAVAAVTLLALSHAAVADEHCPDFGFDTQWLNDFYCARLEALADGRTVPPDRSVGVPDDEAAELIEGVPLVRDAFQADPRSTLDLIDRIRAAGGKTQQ